jgi:hypothetical protein
VFKVLVAGLLMLASGALAVEPVNPTAQDLSLKFKGGADYTTYRGHPTDQFEKDQMEQTLANVWLPQVVSYMESMPACSGYLSNAWSQIPVIYRRLDAVFQYRGRVLSGGTWQVTNGGRHYQIEYYQMQHARQCSLGSGKAKCAELLAGTPLLDLLDLHIENYTCVAGGNFTIPVEPARSSNALDGLVDGRRIFPILDASSEAALTQAETAHQSGMCGMPPSPIGVKAAQDIFIRLAGSEAEAHFRTPPPFRGGCDPKYSPDQCCKWKALEHREYVAWAKAVRLGRWGEVDCVGMRHTHTHDCTILYGPFEVRFPSCKFGDYPDDTPPVTCQEYLASQEGM